MRAISAIKQFAAAVFATRYELVATRTTPASSSQRRIFGTTSTLCRDCISLALQVLSSCCARDAESTNPLCYESGGDSDKLSPSSPCEVYIIRTVTPPAVVPPYHRLVPKAQSPSTLLSIPRDSFIMKAFCTTCKATSISLAIIVLGGVCILDRPTVVAAYVATPSAARISPLFSSRAVTGIAKSGHVVSGRTVASSLSSPSRLMNANAAAMDVQHKSEAWDDADAPPLRRHKPRKVALMVEPTPFTHVSGYANRFNEMLRYMSKAGDNVRVLTVDGKTDQDKLPSERHGYKIEHTQGFTVRR